MSAGEELADLFREFEEEHYRGEVPVPRDFQVARFIGWLLTRYPEEDV